MTLHRMLLTVPIALTSFAVSAGELGGYTVEHDGDDYFDSYVPGYGGDEEQFYDDDEVFDEDAPNAGDREFLLQPRRPGMDPSTDGPAARPTPEIRCSRFYSHRRSAKSPAAAAPRC